jgi:hypothetical protein
VSRAGEGRGKTASRRAAKWLNRPITSFSIPVAQRSHPGDRRLVSREDQRQCRSERNAVASSPVIRTLETIDRRHPDPICPLLWLALRPTPFRSRRRLARDRRVRNSSLRPRVGSGRCRGRVLRWLCSAPRSGAAGGLGADRLRVERVLLSTGRIATGAHLRHSLQKPSGRIACGPSVDR